MHHLLLRLPLWAVSWPLFAIPAVAQRTVLHFQHLTTADGLSQHSVNDLLQDRSGFLWVATQDGLDRYDGTRFVGHRQGGQHDAGPSNNFIWDVHEGPAGGIWVGSFGGGLDRFDPVLETWSRSTAGPGPQELPSGRVFQVDHDDHGRIWVATNNGVAVVDPTGGEVVRILEAAGAERSGGEHFTDHLVHLDGSIWVRTDSGLTRITTHDLQVTHHRASPFGSVPELGEVTGISVSDGMLFVGCGAGLIRIDPRAERDSMILRSDAIPGAVAGIRPRAFCQVDGHGWLGTDQGLVHLPPGGAPPYLYRHDPNDPYSLAHDQVRCLLPGVGGELWIGTDKGLDRLDHVRPPVNVLRGGAGSAATLNDRSVGPLAEDPQGRLWIGTHAGLNIKAGDTLLSFHHDPNDPVSLPSDHLLALHRDRQGNMWVGTRGGGLALAELEQGRLRCRRFGTDKEWLPRTVHGLADGPSGSLWVGTAGQGLLRYVPEEDRWEAFPATGDDRGPSHPYVYVIHTDAHGHVWLGTPTGGLDLFDPPTGRFKAFTHLPEDPASLCNDMVLSLHQRGDTLWVGTANGLASLNLSENDCRGLLSGTSTARFQRYGRSQGFPNEVIYRIAEDPTGRFWISTNQGIARFLPWKGRVDHVITRADGLVNEEFNQNGGMLTTSGLLCFGSVDGLVSFHPEDIVPDPHAPPVHITEIQLDGRPLTVGGGDGPAMDQAAHLTTDLDVDWRTKVIGFTYAALNFVAPSEGRYRYRLEGFQDDWSAWSSSITTSFTNLDPGTYVFHVQGTNSDGVFDPEGTHLTLRVAPPPWRTGWAYAGYVLLAIGAGAFGVRARVRAATREWRSAAQLAEARAQERDAFRSRSAADFHDEAGGRLTRISLHLASARRKVPPGSEVDSHLERAEQAQRELSAGMRDLIWSMDPGRDGLRDTLDRLAAFAETLFAASRTSFRVDAGDPALDEVVLGMNERRNVTLLFKEALNNCAKHAGASECVLKASLEDGALLIGLFDDGAGFDPGKEEGDGHGLRNMRHRAAKAGGRLVVRAPVGHGTQVLLHMPVVRRGDKA